jgi:hypothetical protein
MKTKSKMLVGLLVASLMVMSATAVRAQAIAVPSWVPKNIPGWTMIFNGTATAGVTIGKADLVVSTWAQLFIKNDSTTLQGVAGVMGIEYSEDFFSKALSASAKATIQTYSTIVGKEFTGNTVWDAFFYVAGTVGAAIGTVTDETSKIPTATGAFSLNISFGAYADFYLLFAFKGKYAMMAFAMNFEYSLAQIQSYLASASTAIKTWVEAYMTFLQTTYGTIMTLFAGLSTASDPEPESASGSISPTAPVAETTPAQVNEVGGAYMTALPGGIPGYPVLLVGIASFFAVLVIVQKKRKAIVV